MAVVVVMPFCSIAYVLECFINNWFGWRGTGEVAWRQRWRLGAIDLDELFDWTFKPCILLENKHKTITK